MPMEKVYCKIAKKNKKKTGMSIHPKLQGDTLFFTQLSLHLSETQPSPLPCIDAGNMYLS